MNTHSKASNRRVIWRRMLSILCLVTLWSMPDASFAQDSSKSLGGFEPILRQLPEQPPQSTEKTRSFIDNLSTNDAVFEIKIGQSRLMTLNQDLAALDPEKPSPIVAVSDPTVVDFDILSPRHIRFVGIRFGVTDFSVLTTDREYHSFEVDVVADLDVLRARLKEVFPRAELQLAQLRDHFIVEGTASNTRESEQIIETIRAYLSSVQMSIKDTAAGRGRDEPPSPSRVPARPSQDDASDEPSMPEGTGATPEAAKPKVSVSPPEPQIINLIRVPLIDNLALLSVRLRELHPDAEVRLSELQGQIVIEGQARDTTQIGQITELVSGYADSPDARGRVLNLLRVPGPQQVMLKVQIAELNRTAMRSAGVSFLFQDGHSALGSNIGGGLPLQGDGMEGITNLLNATTNVFGVFDTGDFSYFINALRSNAVLKILAEPNLVAYHGEAANFLAGGEFPVPVPQSGAATGAITIQFKEFGVSLAFVPFILDGDTIRLSVDPEVSTIDFTTGTTVQGTTVPGVRTRRAHTVVEIKQGQTLAMAGLLSLTVEGNTNRVPLLGDLPYVQSLFSNNSHRREEKELLVLVTPYLVESVDPSQAPCLPGDDIEDPNDLEFYLLSRIEGRTGRGFRSTTHWDDPFHLVRRLKLERRYIHKDCGFSR